MDNDIQPTMTVDQFGHKYWYSNDLLHRTDGPAIEYADGDKAWCLNDLLHRTDGPAIEYADGDKWYLHGKRLTFDQWLDRSTGLTAQQKTFFVLQYG
jgi:hypothetical protein